MLVHLSAPRRAGLSCLLLGCNPGPGQFDRACLYCVNRHSQPQYLPSVFPYLNIFPHGKFRLSSKVAARSSSFFDTGPRTETIFNYKVREYSGRFVVVSFSVLLYIRDPSPPPISPYSSVDSEAFEPAVTTFDRISLLSPSRFGYTS